MKKLVVWDPVVRILHWTIALCFFLALSAHRPDMGLHRIYGYLILGSISARFLWGFIGSYYARYSNFIPGVNETLDYVFDMTEGQQKSYPGHNPVGGLMIIVIQVMLTLLCLTGVFTDLTLYSAARTEALISWKALHAAISDFVLLLVGVHIIGVLLMSYVLKEFLPWAMITGYKEEIPGNTESDEKEDES